jgi:Flp pilus assembly pilin Flp
VFRSIRQLFRKESGQDLAEYCLLTALILLIGLGIFYHIHGGVQDLWGTANSTLATGNTSSGTSSTSTPEGNH